MTGPDGWPEAAVGFLKAHLIWRDDPPGWDHMFSSAYQMGVMALAALGHAEETDWGAVPVPDPRLPGVLPRWDDVCVAVLALARQQGLIEYRLPDGSPPPPRGGWRILNAPPPPAPNIAAAHGLGPALISPPQGDALPAPGFRPRPEPGATATLTALGLIADGAWTPIAETILWRENVREWDLDPTGDPRFHGALDLALSTIPDAIRTEIDRLTTITQDDLADSERLHRDAIEEARRRYGPNARIGAMPDADRLRASLVFTRQNDLDWLFYRNWRYPDGWLSEAERARALDIFHDPLAQAMRRALVLRLHPDRAE